MSNYQIQLNTLDKKSVSFACPTGMDIISAAQQADIILVSQCQSGACGSCVAEHQQGQFECKGYSDSALSTEMVEQKQLLLCRTYPSSDLVLQLPYNYDQIQFEQVIQRQATISEKTYLTPDTIKLGLQLLPDADDNINLDFEAGQYIEIMLPDSDEKRAYSLSNTPNWEGYLECLIKLRPDGKFSHFLDKQATVGTSLTIQSPSGQFALQDTGLRPRYFVAGGTGVAPVLSMLRQMAEWQEPHPCRLFFGVWHPQDVFLKDELESLTEQLPAFNYQTCVANNTDTDTWQGCQGSVVDALATALKDNNSQADIYICGSVNLVNAVKQLSQSLDIDETRLIYETF